MPWGDSFVSGVQAGADIRDKKKRRKLEEAEQAMRREFAQKQLDTEVLKMRAGFDHDSGQRALDRAFSEGQQGRLLTHQSTEGEKERGWKTGERTGSEGFQGSQAQLERAARQMALDKELAQRDKIAGAEQTFKQSTLDWEKDPTNPRNQLNAAHADYFRSGTDGGGAPTAPGLPNLPDAQSALEWARQNPNDPRAKAILQRMGQ